MLLPLLIALDLVYFLSYGVHVHSCFLFCRAMDFLLELATQTRI